MPRERPKKKKQKQQQKNKKQKKKKKDTRHIFNGLLLSYKKIMPFAATWMDLEILILSEVSQKAPNDTTYMWNINYGTNESICRTETDSQRIDLWVLRGREREGDG